MSDSIAPSAQGQARYTRPAGSTEFVLVRHGATEGYRPERPFPLVDGHGDPALSEEGEAQALLVGRRLAAERVDALYVTTLRRTLQTAAPFVAASGMQPRVMPDLREVHLGEWEGGRIRDYIAQGHPIWQQVVSEHDWGRIPGAESSAQLQRRCVAALQQLHAVHRDQRVVCIVHGGVIGALASHAIGSRPRAFDGAENGSLHTIVVLGDMWQLRRFNDTTHLDG